MRQPVGHLQLAGVKARRFVHVLQQAARRAHQDVHACEEESLQSELRWLAGWLADRLDACMS